ncbi:MAG TPA: hypothetical protein VN616_11510 [Puia sp.]|nr:hypothetical protein [Puia sp.]
MLTRTLSYFVAALLLLTFPPACSKKGNGGQTGQACELARISIQRTGTQTITLTYDEQGRIQAAETTDPGYPTTEKTYTYPGNMVIMNTSVSGKPGSADSVTLDSSGRVQTDHFTSLSGGSSYLLIYTFAGDQVQKLIEQDSSGTVISSETFTWTGGNLVSVTTAIGGTSFTNTYSYNSEPAAPGDYWSEYQLLNYPVPFIRTANRVTGISNINGTTTFRYAMDGTGKISKITASGANPETDSYQWSCR